MPPASQQNQNDSGLGPFWIILTVFITALLIWYIAQQYIVLAVFKIKLAEIALISLFSTALESWRQAILYLSLTPRAVTFSQLTTISDAIGAYLAWPVGLTLCVGGIIIYLSSAPLRFKATYSMKKLRELEKANWPQITPVCKLDLVNTPIDEGPWAMSMPPLDFAKKYRLIREETLPIHEDELMKEARTIAVLNRQATTRIFALQLGELWQGPEYIPMYMRALFAVFAARANHDTEKADKMLMQFSASATTSGRINFSGVNSLLRKYRNTTVVQFIEQRHAYTLTVMASMLEIARTDGVLASAEFLWLKPIDRRLWYMLNTVGRQTSPTEIAGAYAHWITEKEIGRRMVVPMVEQATNALELSLQEIIYKPDPKNTQQPAKARKRRAKVS